MVLLYLLLLLLLLLLVTCIHLYLLLIKHESLFFHIHMRDMEDNQPLFFIIILHNKRNNKV